MSNKTLWSEPALANKVGYTQVGTTSFNLLLETGGHILLETGGKLLGEMNTTNIKVALLLLVIIGYILSARFFTATAFLVPDGRVDKTSDILSDSIL